MGCIARLSLQGLGSPALASAFKQPSAQRAVLHHRFRPACGRAGSCCSHIPLADGESQDWQCPRCPTCPPRWSKGTSGVGMHSPGAPGGFRLMLLLLEAEQLPCPSPLASAGSFLSRVINRELLASCLSPQAFHRLLPKAVTTCSSSLSNEREGCAVHAQRQGHITVSSA